VREFIQWLREVLGLGTPPVEAEAPSPHFQPIFEDPEAWLRDTEQFARELFGDEK
jgi:hypothetical protein